MLKKTGTRDRGVARAIEQHMHDWQLARDTEPDPLAHEPRKVADFVTISNTVGAGGGDIGVLLGKKLNWPVFDKQILNVMAGEDEQRTRMYSSMDERHLGWCEETFRFFMQTEFRKNDYFQRLTDALFYIARDGPAVFIGRAADLILPRSKGLRVRVIASLNHRVRGFAERNGVAFNEAAKQVNRISRDRRNFIGKYFNIRDDEPTRFDLLLNVECFSPAQAVETILSALKLRGIIS